MSRPQHSLFANTTDAMVYCHQCGEYLLQIHRAGERRLCAPCYEAWLATQPKIEVKPGKPSRRVEWKS